MNSFMSWVGGKKALRDAIVARLDERCDRYVEVFGGGGWVLPVLPAQECRAVRCCCLEDKIRTRSPVLNENGKEIYEFYTKGKNEHESNHYKKRSDRRS